MDFFQRKHLSKCLLLSCTLLAFVQLNLAADERKTWLDVQSYTLAIELNDTTDQIIVTETIVFDWKDTKKIPYFDLIGRTKDGKGMSVGAVRQKGRPLNFIHDQNQLRIIGLQYTGQTLIELEIQYTGIPTDGLVIGKNRFGNRTFFGDNWPNRARCWMACVDHPSDKATIEFKVTAPQHYSVIANGLLTDQKDLEGNRKWTRYTSNIPLPTKVMVIGVADFVIEDMGKSGGVVLSSWVYPDQAELASQDVKCATEILPFYVTYIGEYPFEKLANVQSTTRYGGMENASCIFYDEKALNGKGTATALVAHEIAHQWFGNSASELDWEHVWLSEGFATYFTHLYLEYSKGNEEFQKGLKNDRNRIFNFQKNYNRPLVDPSYDDVNELLNPISYQKGSWILHMLRRKIGDTKFQEGIRMYYEKYKFNNASTDQFKEIMEQVSGRSLSAFFNQWVYKSQHPLLKLSHTANKKICTLRVEQQTNPLVFDIEVNILLKNGNEIKKVIAVKDGITTVEVPINSAVDKINWDPNVNLLFEEIH